MMPFKPVDEADLRAFRGMLAPDRVKTRAEVPEDYAHDEMTEYGSFMPEALLFVLSGAEAAAVLGYCNAQHIAVTPRGSGTGLCGGCVPIQGGVVLSTEKMNRVLEVDTVNMTATLEPGVLLVDFPKALEGTGLFYPPDPGEKTATMGGNAMTNAGGMRAVRFGVTRDYVLGMEIALPTGELLTLGGKVVKNSSGLNLIQLLCGSEGTLGVLTRLTVKLVPEPKENLSLLAPFENLQQCVASVPKVLACGCEPTAVEFMEKEVIRAAEDYLGKRFPDERGNAYLLVRLDGASETALEPALDTLTALLLREGAMDVLLADTDERKMSIWDARGAFLEAIKSGTSSMDECDVVVPRSQIAAFVACSAQISAESGVRIRSFGHAGDGNLHLYALRDALPADVWAVKRAQVMDALYRAARDMGGQVSGEHGIGHAKADYLQASLGGTAVQLMAGIKRAFDPNGILNPGKVMKAQ